MLISKSKLEPPTIEDEEQVIEKEVNTPKIRSHRAKARGGKTDEGNTIECLTSDLKPDSWVTFYLFYFNQGHGSDAAFQLTANRRVYIFVGDIMSAKNNDTILEIVNKKHELAAGEFMHILTQLSDYDLDRFKSLAGAALDIDTQSGKAISHLFNEREDIKVFVSNLRSQGATQLQ